ncbi:hypothetical protein ACVWZ6_007862 [Bradyrhizobium sp. GM6.1]
MRQTGSRITIVTSRAPAFTAFTAMSVADFDPPSTTTRRPFTT